MQVYHGSYIEITEIDLLKSKANKDFGKGFYVTKFREHAENWAKNMANRYHKKPFITEFTFYERAFEDDRYKILRFDDYNEEWLDFVVLNRDPEYTIQRHDYDIVEGPVADDKIQNRIRDYIDGIISKSAFLNELKYHEQTHQICFCTLNSLQMLVKTNQKYVNYLVRINEAIVGKLIIDHGMDEVNAGDLYYKSKTFGKLSDKSTELYERPWQEIYEMLEKEVLKYN
ncbi:MAG: DUF3990 domain-containing protein [Prevotellaceae bacterium]|jgi:hypothetical protein|nr:DUF3990 domain-containing protein [Prevotellaceae bacterium]